MTKSELNELLETSKPTITFVSPWDGITRTACVTLIPSFFGESKTRERGPDSNFTRYRDNDKYTITWSMTEGGWRTIEYAKIKAVGLVKMNGIYT